MSIEGAVPIARCPNDIEASYARLVRRWLLSGLAAGMALCGGAAAGILVVGQSSASASVPTPPKWTVDLDFIRPTTRSIAPACDASGECLSEVKLSNGRWDAVSFTSHGFRGYRQTLGPLIPQLSTTCPSASVCDGITWNLAGPKERGTLLRTIDGGRRWNRVPLPASITIPTSVACPTADACLVLGTDWNSNSPLSLSATTTDGGRSWSLRRLPSALSQEFFVSECPTTSTCYAVDTGGDPALLVETQDFGSTWKQIAFPEGQQGLFFLGGLSCWSASACAVAIRPSCGGCDVARYALINQGVVEAVRPVPGHDVTYMSLSCPTSSNCEAEVKEGAELGVAVATSTEGRTWYHQSLPRGISIADPICSRAYHCAAEGFGRVRNVDYVFLRYQ